MHLKKKKLKPHGQAQQTRKRTRDVHIKSVPASSQAAAAPREESEPDWVIEEDTELLLHALFGGKGLRYRPFKEIAESCPAVWQRALQVFGTQASARTWLETPSSALKGKSPLAVARQAGGERRILQVLDTLVRTRFKGKRRTSSKRRK